MSAERIDYQQEYARRVRGTAGGDLPAVLAHMELLAESGVTRKRISDLTGLSYPSLCRLRNANRVSRRVAETVLSVQTTDAADSAWVPVERLASVLDELRRRGWTTEQIGRRVGKARGPQLDGQRYVQVGQVRRYRALLDEAPRRGRPGPSGGVTVITADEQAETEAIRDGWRTRKTAQRRGDGMVPRDERPRTDETWRDNAACLRPGSPITAVFFSEMPEDVRRAKAVCQACPVQADCLTWALGLPDSEDFGTAGGLTAPERRKARRRSRA